MGDRANIRFRMEDGKSSIYLYAHWAGRDLENRLRSALEVCRDHGRLNDESYGCRIVIQSILPTLEQQPLSWGLSTYRGDNEHDLLEVDFEHQIVRKRSAKNWHDDDYDPEKAAIINEWTFGEFIAAVTAVDD